MRARRMGKAKTTKARQPRIIYPLPGDSEKGGLIGTFGPTDSRGEAKLTMQLTRVGRYSFRAKSEDGRVESAPITVQVLPECKTRGDIKVGNGIIRASINSEVKIEEVERLRDESKTYFDLAPSNLKKVARKEYERTASLANKRIEQLRLIEKSWVVGLGKDGVSLGKSERKESLL